VFKPLKPIGHEQITYLPFKKEHTPPFRHILIPVGHAISCKVDDVVLVKGRDIVVVGTVEAVPVDNVPKVPIDDEKNGAVEVVVETFIPD
jgi:hypothetical protein